MKVDNLGLIYWSRNNDDRMIENTLFHGSFSMSSLDRLWRELIFGWEP
jgi:hypothetical protein